MRSFFFVFLFFLIFHTAYAQNETIEELKMELLDVEGVEKIQLLLKISEELSDLDVELAVKYANEALAAAEINKEYRLQAESSKLLGKCFFDKAQYSKSFSFYSRSLQIYRDEEVREKYSELYNNLALIYTRRGLLDSADIFNDLALVWAEKTQDTVNTVAALRAKGNVFYTRGQFDDAVKAYNHALALSTVCKKCNLEEALLYNNFGVLYSDWNKYEESLMYYKKSLSVCCTQGDTRSEARLYNNIGNLFWQQSQLDSALSYYLKSLELRNKLGDINGKAYVLNNLGMYYGSIEDFEKSLVYFNQSLDMYTNTSNKKGIALALFNIASVYQLTKDFEMARKYFSECLIISENQGFTDYEVDSYKALKEVYVAAGDWEKAYYLLYKYKKAKDSIRKAQNIELLSEMEAEFKRENRRARIKILDDQIQAAKFDEMQTTALILGMVLSIFLILLSIYLLMRQMRFQKQMKDNTLNTTFLRYQFNPELIKSSLAGIKEILGKARIKESGIFLAGLAKLIRVFIDTSSSSIIILEKEIDTTKAFLNLHQMRYDYELNYDINIANYVETEMITVPPFLLFSVYIHIVDFYLPYGTINTVTDIDIKGDYLFIKTDFDYFNNKLLEGISDVELIRIIEKIEKRIKLINKTFENGISFSYKISPEIAKGNNHMSLFLKLPLKSI